MIFRFFDFLKNKQINFALTNGYIDVVSRKKTESDIDILFRKEDFKKIEIMLHEFCNLNGLQFVQVLHHGLWAKNIFLFHPETKIFLNLDLYAELSRRKVVFYKEDEIFDSLDTYEGIPIISYEKEFISYLCKKIDKNDLSIENIGHLSELYHRDKLCQRELFDFFPINGDFISKAVIGRDFKGMLEKRIELLSELKRKRSYFNNSFFLNQYRVLKRIFYPTGVSVSFLGPDGSGKSTIINSILEARLPFRRKDYFHLKPLYIKNIKQNVENNPHRHSVYSISKSLLKISYFVFQYNFGWLKNILPLKIKSSLVIFDRYFDDLLVDQKRYRYGGNIFFIKLARFFLPKPDLYFVLITEPSVIYKRKQEVEFSELERQVKKYEGLVNNKRYYKVDVNNNPDKITQEVISIMMNTMSKKYLIK